MRHRFDTFVRELGDAVTLRTVALLVGTLLLSWGFIASYVGAFHDPSPHRIDVGVTGPQQALAGVLQQLEALPGEPVEAEEVSDRSTAAARIEDGDLVAALVVDGSGTQDELLVASGAGSSLVTAVEQATTQLEAQQGRTFTTTDLVPLESGDARGLSGFYVVTGWIIGGYLMASLMGVAKGARPANPRRAAIRLAAAVPYAAIAGIGGAVIVDPWLSALTGHLWALAGLGTLLVLAAATVTTALQVIFGTVGVGLTVMLFVVLGNPSAGGAFQWQMLPAFWREVGPWLPNGAGTEALRRLVYFDGAEVAGHVAVIGAYAAAGIVVAMVAAAVLHRRGAPEHRMNAG